MERPPSSVEKAKQRLENYLADNIKQDPKSFLAHIAGTMKELKQPLDSYNDLMVLLQSLTLKSQFTSFSQRSFQDIMGTVWMKSW